MGICPTCGGPTEPVELTAKVFVGGKELAATVNAFNARLRAANEIGRRIRESAPRVRRWSWWRFTLLVR